VEGWVVSVCIRILSLIMMSSAQWVARTPSLIIPDRFYGNEGSREIQILKHNQVLFYQHTMRQRLDIELCHTSDSPWPHYFQSSSRFFSCHFYPTAMPLNNWFSTHHHRHPLPNKFAGKKESWNPEKLTPVWNWYLTGLLASINNTYRCWEVHVATWKRCIHVTTLHS
jgi:hypothetical protein